MRKEEKIKLINQLKERIPEFERKEEEARPLFRSAPARRQASEPLKKACPYLFLRRKQAFLLRKAPASCPLYRQGSSRHNACPFFISVIVSFSFRKNEPFARNIVDYNNGNRYYKFRNKGI